MGIEPQHCGHVGFGGATVAGRPRVLNVEADWRPIQLWEVFQAIARPCCRARKPYERKNKEAEVCGELQQRRRMFQIIPDAQIMSTDITSNTYAIYSDKDLSSRQYACIVKLF